MLLHIYITYIYVTYLKRFFKQWDIDILRIPFSLHHPDSSYYPRDKFIILHRISVSILFFFLIESVERERTRFFLSFYNAMIARAT